VETLCTPSSEHAKEHRDLQQQAIQAGHDWAHGTAVAALHLLEEVSSPLHEHSTLQFSDYGANICSAPKICYSRFGLCSLV
jgi:hypothetical protein